MIATEDITVTDCSPYSFNMSWDGSNISFRANNLPIFHTTMGGLPGDVNEEPVTEKKRKKGWRMSCDVGEATKGLENEL